MPSFVDHLTPLFYISFVYLFVNMYAIIRLFMFILPHYIMVYKEGQLFSTKKSLSTKSIGTIKNIYYLFVVFCEVVVVLGVVVVVLGVVVVVPGVVVLGTVGVTGVVVLGIVVVVFGVVVIRLDKS